MQVHETCNDDTTEDVKEAMRRIFDERGRESSCFCESRSYFHDSTDSSKSTSGLTRLTSVYRSYSMGPLPPARRGALLRRDVSAFNPRDQDPSHIGARNMKWLRVIGIALTFVTIVAVGTLLNQLENSLVAREDLEQGVLTQWTATATTFQADPKGPFNEYTKGKSTTGRLDDAIFSDTSSPYAYAFMMFRVDPGDDGAAQSRGAYKPYVADIMVAAELFHRFGSTADIVALISLVKGHDRLPSEDARLLTTLGVKIRYFSPIIPDDFGGFLASNLNKVEILKMTEYRRVLFLDCDVIPLVNLDYLFEMSENGRMKPNIILATKHVPMNGGFFMLEPTLDGFAEVERLIQERLERGYEKKKSDPINGWGVAISDRSPIYRISPRTAHGEVNATTWNFLAANSDQGLFYHYTRFVRRNVTQILRDKLLHYGPGPNGTAIVEREEPITSENNPFGNVTTRRYRFDDMVNTCIACVIGPYMDHAHFVGTGDLSGKPWKTRHPEQYRASTEPILHAMHLWWKTLFQLEERLGFNYTGLWLEPKDS